MGNIINKGLGKTYLRLHFQLVQYFLLSIAGRTECTVQLDENYFSDLCGFTIRETCILIYTLPA